MNFRSLPRYTGLRDSGSWLDWRREVRQEQHAILAGCALFGIVALLALVYFAFTLLASFRFFNPFFM